MKKKKEKDLLVPSRLRFQPRAYKEKKKGDLNN